MDSCGCNAIRPGNYYVSAVIGRGKTEFTGFAGGAAEAPPSSSTGTETEELALFLCAAHAARPAITARLRDRDAADPAGHARLGRWRVLAYSARAL